MAWLNRQRLTIYPLLILACYLAVWGFWMLTGSGLQDRSGKPVGGDFSHYWIASSLVLAGEPAAQVYDFTRLRRAEQALFGPNFAMPWLYPPTFLLMILPLALLPYLASLALWLTLTLLGFLFVVRRIAPHPLTLGLTLAFPGAFQNLIHGQNALLSTALLGGGLLLLDRFPWAGGFLLGLLTYKPHLAALIPVALIAGRRWQALLAMAATAGCLVLASVLVLGGQSWVAFWGNLPFSAGLLESGELPMDKMPTIFAALFLSGAGVWVARVVQGVAMLAMVMLVAWVWRREKTSLACRGAVLVLGILLFVPYAFDYDLALLALPLAWLGWEGFNRGWLPWEQPALVVGWFLPVCYVPLTKATGISVAPLVLAFLMFLAVRRGLRQT